METKFNPNEHLREIVRNRKIKDPATGKESWVKETSYYLDVKWRIVWFREVFPEGYIETKEVLVNDRAARVEATIYDKDPAHGGKRLATDRRQILASEFKDYVEKATTQAVGRALALAGFGTQFCDELDEEDSFADSPVTKTIPTGEDNGSQYLETLYHTANGLGYTNADVNLLIRAKFKGKQPDQLSSAEASEILKGILTTPKEKMANFLDKARNNRQQTKSA